MSHPISPQSIVQTLFILEHLARGSKGYCEANGLSSFEETGYSEFSSPWGLTKTTVCNLLIEVAIKIRIVLDHCYEVDYEETKKLEDQAVIGMQIGYDRLGSSPLSFRESLNKVVHATQVSIDLYDPDDSQTSTHFWDGQVGLKGDRKNKPWSVALVIPEWSRAGTRLVVELDRSKRLVFLGQNFAP